MSYTLSINDGGYHLQLLATFLGEDLLVTCTGGDKPHIGAVAVAQPRSEPDADGKVEVTANIICVSGHREDELARSAAIKLCEALDCTVTVVAGMHWNTIDQAGIAQVVANAATLVSQLQAELSQT